MRFGRHVWSGEKSATLRYHETGQVDDTRGKLHNWQATSPLQNRVPSRVPCSVFQYLKIRQTKFLRGGLGYAPRGAWSDHFVCVPSPFDVECGGAGPDVSVTKPGGYGALRSGRGPGGKQR